MKASPVKASSPATHHTSPFPVIADQVSLSTLRPPTGLLSRAWGWIQARQLARSDTKRLRVAETVSLGEKRFVAVVQVDGRHFLLAGGPTNIALLAQLDDKEPFQEVLKKTMTVASKPPAKRKRPAKRPANHGTLRVEPANPPMSRFNGTETFGDVLQGTMTGAGKQSAKHGRKQNAPPATSPTEHYA
jgi:hypothetical protein